LKSYFVETIAGSKIALGRGTAGRRAIQSRERAVFSP
jgi:hypothetical protein